MGELCCDAVNLLLPIANMKPGSDCNMLGTTCKPYKLQVTESIARLLHQPCFALLLLNTSPML